MPRLPWLFGVLIALIVSACDGELPTSLDSEGPELRDESAAAQVILADVSIRLLGGFGSEADPLRAAVRDLTEAVERSHLHRFDGGLESVEMALEQLRHRPGLESGHAPDLDAVGLAVGDLRTRLLGNES